MSGVKAPALPQFQSSLGCQAPCTLRVATESGQTTTARSDWAARGAFATLSDGILTDSESRMTTVSGHG